MSHLRARRQEVKVLVKDVSTAITAYGSYIAPVQGHTGKRRWCAQLR